MKYQFFNFFLLSIFIVLKHFFLVYNMVRHIFLAYFSLKKRWKKFKLIFGPNPAPLEKYQNFDFFNFVILE